MSKIVKQGNLMIIKENLLKYNNIFNNLINAIDDSSISRESISEQYKTLKKDIEAEIKILSKLKPEIENYSQVESIYLPALKDVHGEMKAKTNAQVNKKMQIDLNSAQNYITYYLSIIK